MLVRKNWHNSITVDRIMDAVENAQTTCDNPGFCLICGDDVDGVEPDARNYRCENCGAREVFGAEELLIMMV